MDNNIKINDNLIRYTEDACNSYSMQNGYNMTKELLESDEEFTAIYAISDSMAIGACKAILDSGNKIPEDYSVVGFDGLDITSYYNPSITTIRQPVEEMAKETTRILFDLINKKSKHQHKVFQGQLLISVGIFLCAIPLIVIFILCQRFFVQGVERSGLVG